jgi:hypothetical protein
MTFDIILIFIGIGIGCFAVICVRVIDKRLDDCKHDWGKWEREKDTEFAVVQSRVCCKCYMHQIHQVRKIEGKV